MTDTKQLLAGIDAGGTTFKCALAQTDGTWLASTRIPTTKPIETLAQCVDFFAREAAVLRGKVDRLGIASFGPVNVDPASPDYGTILATPKPGWSQTHLKDYFETHMGVSPIIDTDVNAALLGEMESGAATGCTSAAYITVGTGIGAGIYANHGLIGKPAHPEFGHIHVQRHKGDDYQGHCPYHADCLEGLASATAFAARFGTPQDLPVDHPGWQMEAYYLAQACWSLSLSFRLERILLGGGLMLAPQLISQVRQAYGALAGGYLGQDQAAIDTLITRPARGDDAGLAGALHLARSRARS